MKNLLFILALLLSSSGVYGQVNPSKIQVFKTVDSVALEMHIFKPKQQTPSASAIVLYFGGGWRVGSPSAMYPQAKYFTDRGMTVFCPQYRTRLTNHTTIYECIQDAQDAFIWVHQHAKGFQIDKNKILAGGGSAGGHLAANLMFAPSLSEQKEAVPAPKALVLFNPVLDVSAQGYGNPAIVRELKSTPYQWDQFSPLHQITVDFCPTLIMNGDQDQVTALARAKSFQAVMQEKGNDCELSVFKGGVHGFFNYGFAQTKKYKPGTKNRYFYETLQAADDFLVQHGFLEAADPILIPADALYPVAQQ
ncbi:alpha/beta hydrolase [Persicobacter psychrovividus]|uniref:Lipase n=1 Tax=Persicobacter psychrovividus TaxID=387638 RepID=A0ABM7VME1_9BACT|nr:lipase [Persicobacter psychrovividus]